MINVDQLRGEIKKNTLARLQETNNSNLNKNPHGQNIGGLPPFLPLTSCGGIFVTRRNQKSNNFLGKIAAAVYQHIAHLSNAGWNGDTPVPPAIKHVAVLTSHQADGLCPLYDNETRLNDSALPANAIRANDKNNGTEEIEEETENLPPTRAFRFIPVLFPFRNLHFRPDFQSHCL
ncbi:hypothetical protein K0M31_020028 [Melipona bicolor]|uniref:Uncharacterized protein n=1 Tax=Melipona bicolor TaxID=60889 RepID=A0AA40KQJ5_9HYME|nr:hypothetical protein K0M31_020028 [Melipona bicolor]